MTTIITSNFNKLSSNVTSKFNSIIESDSIVAKIIKATLVIIVLTIIFKSIEYGINRAKDFKARTPYLLKGTKDAKIATVITQNPKDEESITLKLSDNQQNGLEFSYMFWINIDDYTYKQKEWKHVFHKGTQDGYPLRAPGVWLHPNNNIMRVYMNTLNNINEFIDIKNIPINKWFCVTISCKQKKLDIYINGNLAVGKTLSGIPRQNYGNVYINNFGGFSGNISNLRYFNYYISYSELRTYLNQGPAMIEMDYNNSLPPYLDSKWWTRS
jgi:hypothetical protein